MIVKLIEEPQVIPPPRIELVEETVTIQCIYDDCDYWGYCSPIWWRGAVKGYDGCGRDISRDIKLISEDYRVNQAGVYEVQYILDDFMGREAEPVTQFITVECNGLEESPDLLCSDEDDALENALTSFRERYGVTDTDLNGDGLDEEVQLGLMAFQICDWSGSNVFHTLGLNYYVMLNSMWDTHQYIPDAMIISLLGAVDIEMQDQLYALLSDAGIYFSYEFRVLNCVGGICAEEGQAGLYSGNGDLDGDGWTNLEEYNNVMDVGGSVRDFYYAATDPELNGGESLNPILDSSPDIVEYNFSNDTASKMAQQVVSISNVGSGFLDATIRLVGSPVFTLIETGGSSMACRLERDATQSVTVNFDPERPGLYFAQLHIEGNDGSFRVISLSGGLEKADSLGCGVSPAQDGHGVGDVLLIVLLLALLSASRKRQTIWEGH